MLASTRNERRGPQNFMPLDTCLSFPPSTGTPPIGCVRFMPTHSRSWLRHVFEVVVRVARSPYKPHSRWLASLFLRPFLDNPFLLIRLCTIVSKEKGYLKKGGEKGWRAIENEVYTDSVLRERR